MTHFSGTTEKLQRLFNCDDSSDVTPGRRHFIQGGVAAGPATSGEPSAEAALLSQGLGWLPERSE